MARLRYGQGDGPFVLSSPLTWPALTARGRTLLRLLTKGPALAADKGIPPERAARGILKLTVRATVGP